MVGPPEPPFPPPAPLLMGCLPSPLQEGRLCAAQVLQLHEDMTNVKHDLHVSDTTITTAATAI